MRTRVLVCLVYLSLLSFCAQAAEVSVDFEWRNRYIFNPNVLVVDEPIGTVNLHVAFVNGLYFNTRQAAPSVKQMTEGDYTIGYAFPLSKTPWKFDLSINYYDMFEVGEYVDGDVITPIGRVDYSLPDHLLPFRGSATAFGVFEGYWYLGDTSNVGYAARDGFITYTGIECTWPSWRELELTLGAQYGYATVDFYDSSFVKGWFGIAWSFTPKTSLKVEHEYYIGTDADVGGWVLTFSHTF